jgi:phage tail tape-measure protein
MTRRITISLPDDVAAYAERAGNTSGFIADVLRRRMRADSLRARWAELGYVVTDADVERTRTRLAGLTPISDEQHAANLAWLRQFDHDTPAA